MYQEDPLQKTNQGGLVGKRHNKVVCVYPSGSFRKCPVCLYEKYTGLLPKLKSCSKLYLRPHIKYTPKIWFGDQPYGVNKVSSTVKNLCTKAGFQGKFTNHSLRATSASRMYQNEVPEQIIKEVTGHKSECVRLYKRTSDNIREKASCTISGAKLPNKVKEVKECDDKQESNDEIGEEERVIKEWKERDKQSLTVSQMIKNVIKTRMELRKKCNINVSKVVSKLVKKGRVRIGNMSKKTETKSKKSDPNKYVQDLNVNLNVTK